MGSVLTCSAGRETAIPPTALGHRAGISSPLYAAAAGGRNGEEEQLQPPGPFPSFDCSVCLGLLHQPVRTRCGHVFCQACIAMSLRNKMWTCPCCRVYLPSEGNPATDITKMMKNIYQNCTECEAQVCLSEMRSHLRACDQYIKKYGPLQEVAFQVTRYPCPFCQYELDENDFLDHCLTYHSSEGKEVYCPMCCLLPGGGPNYYSKNFIQHLQLRHAFCYEDYIDINIVEDVLIERVLDRSFSEYVHVNNPNTI